MSNNQTANNNKLAIFLVLVQILQVFLVIATIQTSQKGLEQEIEEISRQLSHIDQNIEKQREHVLKLETLLPNPEIVAECTDAKQIVQEPFVITCKFKNMDEAAKLIRTINRNE